MSRIGGDAAVELAAQAGLGAAAVGRGGEVLVGVDQAGDDELAGEVDDLGAVGDATLARRPRRCDPRRPRATCPPPARPGPVEEGRVAVDDHRHRPSSLAMCLTLRNTCHVGSNTMRAGQSPARRCPCPVPPAPPWTRPSTSWRPSPTATGPSGSASSAARVGLHRATAHRVLVDLVARGWVLRAGDHYLPGPAPLAAVRRRRSQLPRHALPTRDGVAVRRDGPDGQPPGARGRGHPRRRGRPTRTPVDDRAPARPGPDPRPLRRTRGAGRDARRRGPRALPARPRAAPTPCARSSGVRPPTASPWSGDATNRSSPR